MLDKILKRLDIVNYIPNEKISSLYLLFFDGKISPSEYEYLVGETITRGVDNKDIPEHDPYQYEQDLDEYWDNRYKFAKSSEFDRTAIDIYDTQNKCPKNPYKITPVEVLIDKLDRIA